MCGTDGLLLVLVQRCWAAGLAELGADCPLSCWLWGAVCPGRGGGLLSCFAEPACSRCCNLMAGDAPVGLLLQVGCVLMRRLFFCVWWAGFPWGKDKYFEWKMGFLSAKSHGFPYIIFPSLFSFLEGCSVVWHLSYCVFFAFSLAVAPRWLLGSNLGNASHGSCSP